MHPPLEFNETQIKEVGHHKHIGLHFSNDGTWTCHIEAIIKKSNTALNMLHKLKYVLDHKSLTKLNVTQVRPIMEYGDCVWTNITTYQKKIGKRTVGSRTHNNWGSKRNKSCQII